MKVFKRIKEFGLKTNLNKFKFLVNEINFLGRIVMRELYSPLDELLKRLKIQIKRKMSGKFL